MSADSVTRFRDKVNGYVATNTQAKNHNKYKLILENINDVILHIVIDIHDEWEGDTTITF